MASKLARSSENEEVHFSDYQPKIEIVRCPEQKSECVAQLPQINRWFNESQQLRLNKDYRQCIKALEQAFECTFGMQEKGCETCAGMFRQLILTTLEELLNELRQLTSGWLGARDYRAALDEATHVLQACRIRM